MSTALQTRNEKLNSFRTTLTKMKDQIALALPQHIDRDRMLRVVMTTLQRTPSILNCTEHSVLAAIMQAAQLGLEPDGNLGLAYLLPYGNQCQLIIGYKGLIELARRSGLVRNVRAHVVYLGDYFEYELGLNPKLKHIPQDMLELHSQEIREKAMAALGDQPPQSILLAAYAIIDLKDDTQQFEVIGKSFVERIKRVSQSAKHPQSPWRVWEDAMWKKTAIKQALKYVPLSPEDKLSTALQRDERTYIGISDVGDFITVEDSNGAAEGAGDAGNGAGADPGAPPSAMDRFAAQQGAGTPSAPQAPPPPAPPQEAAGAEAPAGKRGRQRRPRPPQQQASTPEKPADPAASQSQEQSARQTSMFDDEDDELAKS